LITASSTRTVSVDLAIRVATIHQAGLKKRAVQILVTGRFFLARVDARALFADLVTVTSLHQSVGVASAKGAVV
jgi:hypothetical protein